MILGILNGDSGDFHFITYTGRSLWVFRQLALVHCLRSISIHLLFPPISLLTRFTQSFFSSRPPQIGHLGSSLLFTKNMLLFVVLYCVVCYDYHGVKPWIPKRRLPCQGRGSPGSPFFLSLNDILYGSRVTRNEISSWSYWVSSYTFIVSSSFCKSWTYSLHTSLYSPLL